MPEHHRPPHRTCHLNILTTPYFGPAKPLAGKRAALITIAADSGFATQERIFTAWLTCYGAEILGKVRLLAREMGDLEGSPSEIRKLDALVRRVGARLAADRREREQGQAGVPPNGRAHSRARGVR
jgi:hypothetical protein